MCPNKNIIQQLYHVYFLLNILHLISFGKSHNVPCTGHTEAKFRFVSFLLLLWNFPVRILQPKMTEHGKICFKPRKLLSANILTDQNFVRILLF